MKNKYLLCLLLGLSFVLCACGDALTTGGGGFLLYYTNSEKTSLNSYSYNPKKEDTVAIVQEIFEEMESVDISGSASVIPSEVKFKGAETADKIITLNLLGSMENVTTQEKNLFYASMSRAVTQIEGIEGITIKINDANVTDGAGKTLGVIRPSMFISNAADDFEDYKETTITLYYANATLDHLVKTTNTVYYRSTTPIERVIVEQLIAGPEKTIYSATLPASLTILGVNVRDGVCYVNLDKQFTDETVTSYDEIPVYSIVNSLTSLDDINSVQISINGNTSVTMPQGRISLECPLKFNENIVE